MTNIDKQRISAVRVLDALGFTVAGSEWQAPGASAPSLVLTAMP